MEYSKIEIYTDGSCHTNFRIGSWGAILLLDEEKTTLHGEEQNTTHNRMELLAVIKAIEFIDKKGIRAPMVIYTDSQYVYHIRERKEKLKANHFITNKGTPIQNIDLVKTLITQIESHSIHFIKVKAHQKSEKDSQLELMNSRVNYNREVDKLVRETVRKCIRTKTVD